MNENETKDVKKSIYRQSASDAISGEAPAPEPKKKKSRAPRKQVNTSEMPAPEAAQANPPEAAAGKHKIRRKKSMRIIAVATCLVVILGASGIFLVEAEQKQRELAASILDTSVEASLQIAVPNTPNVLTEFDFSALAAGERNATIKSMHEYFAGVQPTFTNAYTGMFEGYNFIQIIAEAFSPYLLTLEPDLFPNLNRLYNEGFQFTNFYTPFFYHSTSDGEYVTLQSQLPITGRRSSGSVNMYMNSMIAAAKNYLPQTTAHQLADEGYSLLTAYHNYRYTFYQRQRTHPNLGYKWVAIGNGLNVPYSWPTSDIDLMNATVSTVVAAQEPFHVYYLTMSGHGNYNWSGNRMCARHRSEVAHLPYPEYVKAYLACNLELDRAVGILLDELEKAGLSDRTLISLSADHYPYGINKEATDAMSKLAGRPLDAEFGYFESNWLLWSGSMTQPIVVDTLACNMDILPTLNNLLGIKWESRLLMGRDVFSDAERLVIFGSHNWMTALGRYDASTGQFTPNDGVTVADGYVEEITAMVEQQFLISNQILKNNYFKIVYSKSGLI